MKRLRKAWLVAVCLSIAWCGIKTIAYAAGSMHGGFGSTRFTLMLAGTFTIMAAAREWIERDKKPKATTGASLTIEINADREWTPEEIEKLRRMIAWEIVLADRAGMSS